MDPGILVGGVKLLGEVCRSSARKFLDVGCSQMNSAAFSGFRPAQWNLTIKTPHGTSYNGLDIEVVSILSYHFSKINIFHAKIGEIQYLNTHYCTMMVD